MPFEGPVPKLYKEPRQPPPRRVPSGIDWTHIFENKIMFFTFIVLWILCIHILYLLGIARAGLKALRIKIRPPR